MESLFQLKTAMFSSPSIRCEWSHSRENFYPRTCQKNYQKTLWTLLSSASTGDYIHGGNERDIFMPPGLFYDHG